MEIVRFLNAVRQKQPMVHHLTNWVTIYDCAQVVKSFGGSPVMAHAKEEVAEMTGLASALVLNIGTLSTDFVHAMKLAAHKANEKGIPVILDVCGAGATAFRDQKSYELLNDVKIDILKGNSSEIARIARLDVQTKGVDASEVDADLCEVALKLAEERNTAVVITGKEDIVSDGNSCLVIQNGVNMMEHVVGTGCMAASVIGLFAGVVTEIADNSCAAAGNTAVLENYLWAATAGLVCFEIAAEQAAKKSDGPASFKQSLFDCISGLDGKEVNSGMRVVRQA